MNKIMTSSDFLNDLTTNGSTNIKGTPSLNNVSAITSYVSCLGMDKDPDRCMWFTGSTNSVYSHATKIVSGLTKTTTTAMVDPRFTYTPSSFVKEKLVEDNAKNKLSNYFHVIGFGGHDIISNTYFDDMWPEYTPDMNIDIVNNGHYHHLASLRLDTELYTINPSNTIFPPVASGNANFPINVSIHLNFPESPRYDVNYNAYIGLISTSSEVQNFYVHKNGVDDDNYWDVQFTGESTTSFMSSLNSFTINDFTWQVPSTPKTTLTVDLANCYLNSGNGLLYFNSTFRTNSGSRWAGVTSTTNARVINPSNLGSVKYVSVTGGTSSISLAVKSGQTYITDTKVWVELPIKYNNKTSYLYMPVTFTKNGSTYYFSSSESINIYKHCQISLFHSSRTYVQFENYDGNDFGGDQYYIISGLYDGSTIRTYRLQPSLGVGEGGPISKTSGSYNDFLTNEMSFYNDGDDTAISATIRQITPFAQNITTIHGTGSVIPNSNGSSSMTTARAMDYLFGYSPSSNSLSFGLKLY